MRNFLKKYYTIAVTVIITAVLSFMSSSAYYNGKLFIKPGGNSKYNVVKNIIDKYYYGQYDKNAAAEAAVKSYVDSLGDPYTTYFNKDDLKNFNSIINSSYCGIGVRIQSKEEEEYIKIVKVFDNSPAQAAGIKDNDLLISVNGTDLAGKNANDASDLIQGEEGTDVTVVVRHSDTGTDEELTLKRANIEVDVISSEIFDNSIGYIRIQQFSKDSGKEFAGQLDELNKSDIKGLIIDVRDNGGGINDEVEIIADCLLPKGKVIYYTSDKFENKKYVYSKIDGVDIPLVVLANAQSASASEILIGSIIDNGRGKFVGQKTYGKGVVQQLISLSDGTAVKVTIEKYFTPNGTDINKKGIQPDYEVLFTENDTTDIQLEKAIELLK